MYALKCIWTYIDTFIVYCLYKYECIVIGAVNQKNREVAWLRKRIIFATPQVFHNDLEKSIVPSHLVKCVVVDEAHKALGKHSYCEVKRDIEDTHIMYYFYYKLISLVTFSVYEYYPR